MEKNKKRKIRPKSSITCRIMNCVERENRGNISLSCVNCRDKNACYNES